MAQRKSVSKGLRFDIFKRDGFTCQYCGAHPPDVVLEVDHIMPVSQGGTNDQMNLVTACEECNRGKGKKMLSRPQRPDADLAWLEAQQEIAELRRYQETKLEHEALVDSVIKSLQRDWVERSGLDWAPNKQVIRKMLNRYSPEMVEEALVNVAVKVGGGYLSASGADWLKYTWGVLKNLSQEADHAVT